MHDNRINRAFLAGHPNQIWLTDISEHPSAEGKVYLCAVKDTWSNRIAGYSISDRMMSELAVRAFENAIARRSDVAGCIVHSDRGIQFRSRRFVATLERHSMVESMGRVGAPGDNAAIESAGLPTEGASTTNLPGAVPMGEWTPRTSLPPITAQPRGIVASRLSGQL